MLKMDCHRDSGLVQRLLHPTDCILLRSKCWASLRQRQPTIHGNAKKMLKLVQLVLRVAVEMIALWPRAVLKCPHCQSPLNSIGFIRPNWQPGQAFLI